MTSCQKIMMLLPLPIYGQFRVIWKPDSRRIVCKTYIFINSNFLSYKNWKQNQKTSNTFITLLFWVKVIFWPKHADSLQKMLTSAKLRRLWHQKVYFLKLQMGVYLHATYHVSSIILTSFRLGVILPPATSKPTPKKPN